MKKTALQFKITAVLVIAIGGIAMFAAAMENRHENHVKLSLPKVQKEPAIVYDPVLLKKFSTAIRSLDFNQPACTYSGVINLEDPNDTTNSIHEVKFVFSRSGKDYYYKLGPTELISRGGIYLFIQNDQHKVVRSPEPLTLHPPAIAPEMIAKGLSSENYTLNNTIRGTKQTLALVNEHHLSCRELSVTLNTATGQLERIHSRLTDIGSPMDKGRERVMDVRITSISGKSDLRLFPAIAGIIHQAGGQWKLSARYANYELISL